MLDGRVGGLISGLILVERGPCPAALFTLHSLPIVHEIDLRERVVLLLFPPISLLVQPQKVPYHCRMSGHTLPSGLAMSESPLIDFALPLLGKHKLARPISSNNSLKGIINHDLCPSAAHNEVVPTRGGVGQGPATLEAQGGPCSPASFLLNLIL